VARPPLTAVHTIESNAKRAAPHAARAQGSLTRRGPLGISWREKITPGQNRPEKRGQFSAL